MTEADDIQLLREFAERRSDAAFATLVTRYVNLVYSVGLRQTGNLHAAEEITQAVFIILARKAGSLTGGWLRRPRRQEDAGQHQGGAPTSISGWLYQTARFTAMNYRRSEFRRVRCEQEAYMQSILNQPEPDVWPQIAPLLDDALGNLGEKDRHAIVLRFFEDKRLGEVGAVLGVSEDAAKMRVNRALEKLRKAFTKRGVTLTAALVADAVLANSVQAAPVGLAETVTVAAAKGSTLAASIAALVKGTMKIMTWLKIKFAIGVGVVAILAGGAVSVAVSQNSGGDKLTAQEIARQSQDAYAVLSSYSDSGTVGFIGLGANTKLLFNIRLQRPNLYRIDWTQTGRSFSYNRTQTGGSYTNKGVVWSDGSGNYFVSAAAGHENTAKPEKMKDMQMAFVAAKDHSGQAASIIPGIFFKQHWGEVFGLPASGWSELKKERDESIGGVDCYVISNVMKEIGKVKKANFTRELWIGKRDHLIHQTRDTTVTEDVKFVITQIHENIVANQKFSPADFTR